jgi:hypothetical protein
MMMQLQRCFAVKSGVDSLLDISRQALNDVMDDIYELSRTLSEQYELSSLKVAWRFVMNLSICTCAYVCIHKGV